MKIIRLTAETFPIYQERIAALEKIAWYPLGEDSFQIDHGRDYFAFFRRMGQLEYYICVDGDEVAAVGAGVLRSSPKGWYLGDLKVHLKYRGQRLPLKMLSKAFLPNYLRCRRGYAISMNPSDGSPNRIVRLLQNFRWAPIHFATKLWIYSLDTQAMRHCEPILRAHRGPVGYLSLQGIKDLILKSTGAPLPLIHVQFGPNADHRIREPVPGATHMFACPDGDALQSALAAAGINPTASASIVHHGMNRLSPKGLDWNFVLTSEI